jgi:glycosyltransferase involved in cell wall biosynthesis
LAPRLNKLLFIDNRSQYFVSHRLHWAKALRDRGVQVHAITLSRRPQDLDRLESERITYHPLRSNANDRSILKPMLMAMELSGRVRAVQPDLLHIVTLKAMCVASIGLCFSRRVRTIMTVTGLGFAFTSNSLKARCVRVGVGLLAPLIRRTGQRFILQNQDDMAAFGRLFGVPEERMSLIRGVGVDTVKYQPTPEPEGPPVVVLPSRMLRDKGIFEFVEAAGVLRAQGVHARFILVGDADPENPTGISETQLRAWHDSGAVEFAGFRDDMPSVYARCHIVCLPSYGEGLPASLMEAAACGRPAVATDVPGCREIVRHEDTGLLVPARDGQTLAAALRRLIDDAELRISMGRRARAMVERELSRERILGQLLELYDAELGGPA